MPTLVRRIRQLTAWSLGLVLLGTTAVALTVALFPRVTDGQALAVLSGSMTPAMPVGAMVFTQPVDTDDVSVGDVLTFVRPGGAGELVTHRVVAVDTSGREPLFSTQGDANDVADLDPVPAAAVVGEPRWVVPELGRWAAVLHSPRGLGALVLMVCAVVATAPSSRVDARGPGARGDVDPPSGVEPVEADAGGSRTLRPV